MAVYVTFLSLCFFFVFFRARVIMPLSPLLLCQKRKESLWLWSPFLILPSFGKGCAVMTRRVTQFWLQLCLGNLVGSNLGKVRPTVAFATFPSHSYLSIAPLFICSQQRDWAHGRRSEMVMVIHPIHLLFWESVKWPFRIEEWPSPYPFPCLSTR